MAFFKLDWNNVLFWFCTVLTVIVVNILQTESLPYPKSSNYKTNRNYLPFLNKDYCKIPGSENEAKYTDLITSIVEQMQENADGTMTCFSIFVDDDSFSEGRTITRIDFSINV